MSDAATSEQLLDLRADIGDAGTPQAFTDAEIQRYWYRVRGADEAATQHEATLALLARALMTNGAKLRDYSTGNTSERMSQVHDHLKELYALYKPALDRALGLGSSVVMGVIGDVVDGEAPLDETAGTSLGYWKRPPDAPEFS